MDDLEAKYKAAIAMLANWVHDIDRNGTGWDDWDENYKDAAYRENILRADIDAELEVLRKERSN